MQHPRVIDHCGEIFGKYRSLRGALSIHTAIHGIRLCTNITANDSTRTCREKREERFAASAVKFRQVYTDNHACVRAFIGVHLHVKPARLRERYGER